MDWKGRFAHRITSQVHNDLGFLLQLLNRPEVISFAGGVPDPEVFLVDRVKEVVTHVLDTDAAMALQYGTNYGYRPLREWVAGYVRKAEGIEADAGNVLITSGGLEALSMISKLFIDPGDLILVEGPTYLGMIQLINSFEGAMQDIAVDEDGMRVDALEAKLKELRVQGRRPKFIYCISSFQNPAGVTLSLPRREKLAELLEEHDLVLIEDNAYGAIRYEGESLPAVASLAPEHTIFVGTFSKIFSPGVRVGWVIAPEEIVHRIADVKMTYDQCGNSLTQRMALEYGRRGYIARQVARTIPLLRRKRDLMLEALERHMPEGTSWTRPEGGFFIWVTLPEPIDTLALLPRAVEELNVAYVAGPPFFHDRRGSNCMRLSLSLIDEDSIDVGIARLGRLFQKALP